MCPTCSHPRLLTAYLRAPGSVEPGIGERAPSGKFSAEREGSPRTVPSGSEGVAGRRSWSRTAAAGSGRAGAGHRAGRKQRGVGGCSLDLIERALTRRLIGPPAQEMGPVAEASSREVIITDLDHELRDEGLPLRRSRCTPSAWPARGSAGEA